MLKHDRVSIMFPITQDISLQCSLARIPILATLESSDLCPVKPMMPTTIPSGQTVLGMPPRHDWHERTSDEAMAKRMRGSLDHKSGALIDDTYVLLDQVESSSILSI